MNNEVETKTNGFAIAGILCTFLVSALVGLILSIVGLVKSKTYNSGKTLSIIGIILAVLKMIITFIIIIVFCLIMFLGASSTSTNAYKCKSKYACTCTKSSSTCLCKYKNSQGNVESIYCEK